MCEIHYILPENRMRYSYFTQFYNFVVYTILSLVYVCGTIMYTCSFDIVSLDENLNHYKPGEFHGVF